MTLEKSLVLIKPDGVRRGLVGQILSRFERLGLTIVGLKLIQATPELINRHYPIDRRKFIEGLGQTTLDSYQKDGLDGANFFPNQDKYQIGLKIQGWLVKHLTSSPLIALVVQGPLAISLVRKIRGFTIPNQAAPGTILGDYGADFPILANSQSRSIYNLVHASGNPEEAAYEIKLWFKDQEIHDYQNLDQAYLCSDELS